MASASTLMVETLRAVFTPRARPRPDEWCDQYRVIPARAADRPGRWDTAVTPYLREPFRVFADPDVEEITFQKSAQVGASEWGISLIMYTLAVAAQNAMVVYPNQDDAIEFNTDRIRPAIELCEPFDAIRTGRAHDEKMQKLVYRTASLYMRWANSASGLRSKPCPNLFLDEFDLYPPGAADQARSRATTFPIRKIVKWSTPMHEGLGVDREYAISDQRRYMVPCPHSGQYFELYDWSLLQWEGGSAADPVSVEKQAWIQSPFVEGRAGRIYEHHKQQMLADGVWVKKGELIEGSLDREAMGPIGPIGPMSAVDGARLRCERVRGVKVVGEPVVKDSRHVGFRMNALISPWKTWGRLAREWVEMKGDPTPDWVRENLGQPWRARGQRMEVTALEPLCVPVEMGGYRTGSVPDGCLVLVTTIDVQSDHVWMATIGFGEQLRCVYWIGMRRLAAPVGEDLASIDAAVFGQQYDLLGTRMRPALIGIDHGHRAKEVERFRLRGLALRRRVILAKGEGTYDGRWMVKPGQSETGMPLMIVNTNHMKDWATSLMGMEAEKESGLRLPADCDPEIMRQLTAEERVYENQRGKALMRRGFPVSEWRLRPGRRDNHAFDLLVMALAIGEAHGFEGLREQHVQEVRAGQVGRRSVIRGPLDGRGNAETRR